MDDRGFETLESKLAMEGAQSLILAINEDDSTEEDKRTRVDLVIGYIVGLIERGHYENAQLLIDEGPKGCFGTNTIESEVDIVLTTAFIARLEDEDTPALNAAVLGFDDYLSSHYVALSMAGEVVCALFNLKLRTDLSLEAQGALCSALKQMEIDYPRSYEEVAAATAGQHITTQEEFASF